MAHSYRQDQKDNVLADGNGPATVPKEGAGGNHNVAGDLAVTGNAAVNGTLGVTGLLSTEGSVVVGGTLTISQATPASAAAAGTTGTIAVDTGFIYVCTATNTWKRVAIATW